MAKTVWVPIPSGNATLLRFTTDTTLVTCDTTKITADATLFIVGKRTIWTKENVFDLTGATTSVTFVRQNA